MRLSIAVVCVLALVVPAVIATAPPPAKPEGGIDNPFLVDLYSRDCLREHAPAYLNLNAKPPAGSEDFCKRFKALNKARAKILEDGARANKNRNTPGNIASSWGRLLKGEAKHPPNAAGGGHGGDNGGGNGALVALETRSKAHQRMRGRLGARSSSSVASWPFARSSAWANAIVYYEVESSLSAANRATLANALNALEAASCLRFFYRTSTPRILVKTGTDPNACWGSSSEFNFAKPPGLCLEPQATHEILHGVGARHIHARTDRNTYLVYTPANVDPKLCNAACQAVAFGIETGREDPHTGFDYKSIMGYPASAFAKSGTKTLDQVANLPSPYQVANHPWDGTIGTHLGTDDINAIKQFYNCATVGTRSLNHIPSNGVGPTQLSAMGRDVVNWFMSLPMP